MVVHGIPGPYTLQDGDVISVDVGVTLDGFVADSAYTFPVGTVDDEAGRLLEVGQAALKAGIDQARAGNHVQDISRRRPAHDKRPQVSPSFARSSATGSEGRCTRSLRCRTSASPARVPCFSRA